MSDQNLSIFAVGCLTLILPLLVFGIYVIGRVIALDGWDWLWMLPFRVAHYVFERFHVPVEPSPACPGCADLATQLAAAKRDAGLNALAREQTGRRLAQCEAALEAAEARVPAAEPVQGFRYVPEEPSQAVLESMAMRYRQDFGLLETDQQDSILGVMRQLYEEAIGKGFYQVPSPPEAPRYRHYKHGDVYRLVWKSRLEADRDVIMATYVAPDGESYSRPLSEFAEIVRGPDGLPVKRFTLVNPGVGEAGSP